MESLKGNPVLTNFMFAFFKAHGKAICSSVISCSLLVCIFYNVRGLPSPYTTANLSTCGQCIDNSDPVDHYPLPKSNLSALVASLR